VCTFTSDKFTGVQIDETKQEVKIKSIAGVADNAVDVALHASVFCERTSGTADTGAGKSELKPGRRNDPLR